ncbi:hypothetical protein BB561_000979 [Smittium simulii]|uniref:Uncharacterized protein n=1 Tax=Smittium simulii TaxID=133385 RepID=A0A2T9YWR7_9FUNG|nr:hypothetical protein BB561_000979 [Smittium simulii]
MFGINQTGIWALGFRALASEENRQQDIRTYCTRLYACRKCWNVYRKAADVEQCGGYMRRYAHSSRGSLSATNRFSGAENQRRLRTL